MCLWLALPPRPVKLLGWESLEGHLVQLFPVPGEGAEAQGHPVAAKWHSLSLPGPESEPRILTPSPVLSPGLATRFCPQLEREANKQSYLTGAQGAAPSLPSQEGWTLPLTPTHTHQSPGRTGGPCPAGGSVFPRLAHRTPQLQPWTLVTSRDSGQLQAAWKASEASSQLLAAPKGCFPRCPHRPGPRGLAFHISPAEDLSRDCQSHP